MRTELKAKTLATIEAYLGGKLTKKQVAAWAVEVLATEIFSTGELLLEDTITALAGLHDDDDRFDTAEEDLLYYRDCLQEGTLHRSRGVPGRRHGRDKTDI